MTITETTAGQPALAAEYTDLLETLAKHRFFLTYPARELTDEQATTRSTVSELTIGGLIKHVTVTERQWLDFARTGSSAMKDFDQMTADDYTRHAQAFALQPGETLAGVLADYEQVAAETTAFIESQPDLDVRHALPAAPWFEPGASWSVRRVLMHLIAEAAQHAGHADILRESIDGAKSMG